MTHEGSERVMATARLRIGTLGLSLMMSIGLAGQAAAQSPVIPSPQPWNAPPVDVPVGADAGRAQSGPRPRL